MAWQNAFNDSGAMAKSKRPDAYSVTQAGIGARIQWARELVEPNQSAFARLLGIEPSTLNKIEAGTRAPSVFNILAISNRLRVSTDFLLKGMLVARSDEEMGLRLAARHPELVDQQIRKERGMGTNQGDDKPSMPTIRFPEA